MDQFIPESEVKLLKELSNDMLVQSCPFITSIYNCFIT
jgi:hypothetical protein